MKSDVVDIFKSICKIEHCSFNTQKLKDFIISLSMQSGARVQSDEAGNVLVSKGEPKLCLQSHYDMVCMGKAPNIEVVDEGGFLKAVNSSLGADNGIGVAIMLKMLSECEDIECLFTNDEEVGLIGANDLTLKIQSPNLLNLDTERIGEVCIGCAGGVDVVCEQDLEFVACEDEFYEVSISGLDGGHSGIQIDENIPNAIKLLVDVLGESAKIYSLVGGERINSIPTFAKAIVNVHVQDERFEVRSVGKVGECIKNSSQILKSLRAFSQGVRGYDKTLQVPNKSINLSLINMDKKSGCVKLFARANENELLDELMSESKALFEFGGFEVSFKYHSKAWRAEVNDFSLLVQEEAKKVWGEAHFKVIHAGIECGVIIDKQPTIKACSIGPNIFSPHTVHESCEIKTIYQVLDIVSNIIKRI